MRLLRGWVLLIGFLCAALTGCVAPRPGAPLNRRGDEIVAAGQFIHTGTPVVLWLDPGGYDAYRVERRFAPLDQAGWEETSKAVRDLDTPNRYSVRRAGLTPEQLEEVRGGGWDLDLLRERVDQFVLHYDVCGTSKQCFKVLHDLRGLSVHFMLDLDGTIYQTLDLKERAWHATSSNDRSIGIEIAHIGAYSAGLTNNNPLKEWYRAGTNGVQIEIPKRFQPAGIRTPDFVGKPARPELIQGELQGRLLEQYDFTPEQYAALIKLTAALCKTFPKIKCDYPRDAAGALVLRKLPDDELKNYQGVLGHFHIQTNKVDPGPALQWDRLIREARRWIRGSSLSRSKI